ncbi:hypothetical protein ACFL0F_02025 [Patescibacteria group bacterium]
MLYYGCSSFIKTYSEKEWYIYMETTILFFVNRQQKVMISCQVMANVTLDPPRGWAQTKMPTTYEKYEKPPLIDEKEELIEMGFKILT